MFVGGGDKGLPVVQGPDVCFGRFLNCSAQNCTHGGGDKCADLRYFDELLAAADGAIGEVTVHNCDRSPPPHPRCISTGIFAHMRHTNADFAGF